MAGAIYCAPIISAPIADQSDGLSVTSRLE
jgi:hypothetical protein